MRISLDWLGCATFRVTIGDLVLFLDAYIDRVATAAPVGLTVADVRSADFVLVGHSHFDHAWGAERIAISTGARVIGSHETIRLMRDAAVAESQCIAVSGGERVALAKGITVRVLPSQHSCIWARASWNAGEACVGDVGLTVQERESNLAAGGGWLERDDRPGMDAVRAHFAACPHHPRGDGGALAYVIETPVGSIFWKDTSGHWTAVLRDLRPDVAILAASGRGNVDGEPIQGTLAEFIAREVELLHPRRVLLGHHDDWMPPTTRAIDTAPIRHELARRAPDVELVETGYLAGYDPIAAIR